MGNYIVNCGRVYGITNFESELQILIKSVVLISSNLDPTSIEY